MSDLLEQLIGHLEDGEVPRAWLEQHGAHESLELQWHACKDPSLLLRLSMHTHDGPTLVAALAACVRETINSLPAEALPRSRMRGAPERDAIDSVLRTCEAWCTGRDAASDVEDVTFTLSEQLASDDGTIARENYPHPQTKNALGLAWYLGELVADITANNLHEVRTTLVEATELAVQTLATARACANDAAAEALAHLVRACAPCPAPSALLPAARQ